MGEGEAEDTGASSSGSNPAIGPTDIASESQPPIHDPTRQRSPAKTATLTRAEAIMAFLAAPLQPKPGQIRFYHSSVLMAMAVDGDTQTATVKLLAPDQS